jgi:anaerobic ribonucleoside-triphosphate reductase
MSNKKVPVEVYSRVVGYFRPVNQWNKGKQEEFHQRKEFSVKSLAEKVCACER